MKTDPTAVTTGIDALRRNLDNDCAHATASLQLLAQLVLLSAGLKGSVHECGKQQDRQKAPSQAWHDLSAPLQAQARLCRQPLQTRA
jgi:hypothetical protein